MNERVYQCKFSSYKKVLTLWSKALLRGTNKGYWRRSKTRFFHFKITIHQGFSFLVFVTNYILISLTETSYFLLPSFKSSVLKPHTSFLPSLSNPRNLILKLPLTFSSKSSELNPYTSSYLLFQNLGLRSRRGLDLLVSSRPRNTNVSRPVAGKSLRVLQCCTHGPLKKSGVSGGVSKSECVPLYGGDEWGNSWWCLSLLTFSLLPLSGYLY